MIFQNPPYTDSRQLVILRIAAAGTSFSPIPCQAWHGYRVTSAHRVKVEIGADGSACATLSGAAATSPPAGAGKRESKRKDKKEKTWHANIARAA
jgi:hypothetical protein